MVHTRATRPAAQRETIDATAGAGLLLFCNQALSQYLKQRVDWPQLLRKTVNVGQDGITHRTKVPF